ncbi:hypothetical protein AB4262_05550 [Vibrio breoganii]|uniref:hypothetical protein n=1 Tax=Vibrio breoganii TaxID=553239 RepID=UPI0010556CC0|nr:hypothetical protein [Vibrio breoganii]
MTYIFQQVENYHVIQLVVISDYNDFPVSLSPYFLGFDSFISYIIGDTPTETLLAGYLQNVEIYAYNGDGPFNAFGTSLSYFYPLFGVLIGTSVFLLLFLVLYLSMFRFFKNKREPIIILFGFLVYFSAFAPLLFSFSSYSFMAIFIFSCFRLRKGKRHNYVFLSR